jgi:hypothetical protein
VLYAKGREGVHQVPMVSLRRLRCAPGAYGVFEMKQQNLKFLKMQQIFKFSSKSLEKNAFFMHQRVVF